ncbi:MAG: restriction endonuclease subunit S [Bacteroidetes bacterium]|nr:restriction endonuclease subunit S [Bacteroidota bacterium]
MENEHNFQLSTFNFPLKKVEWKTLGEVCKVLRGKRLTKKELSENEKFPVFHGGLEPLGFFSNSNRPADTVMIINVGASAGTVGYSPVDFWSSDGCFCLEHSRIINNKFLYYFLVGEQHFLKSRVRVAGIPTLDNFVVEKLLIPIPPLPVQKEIVRILDTFTELTAKLTAELTAELTARKKQYHYYRESLLDFSTTKNTENTKTVEWKTLGEVGEFVRGKRFVKDDMISKGIPCIHYGEMYTQYNIWAKESKSFLSEELVVNKKLRIAEKGDVVIVAAGETIEDIGMGTAWLSDEGVAIHDACFSFRSPINAKYVAYFTRTKQFHDQIKKHVSSGKISAINARGLEKVLIPVPSPEEQARIVSILDKFDTLTTSISEGLPKEIELRKKQYAYYRDQLLTFPSLRTARNEQEAIQKNKTIQINER